METTDPGRRQANSCRLWSFLDVWVQVPHEFPLVEKAQDQPGFACARIAESAIEFRSADRQFLEQSLIDFGFIAHASPMTVGIMVAPGLVLAEEMELLIASKPAGNNLCRKGHPWKQRLAF